MIGQSGVGMKRRLSRILATLRVCLAFDLSLESAGTGLAHSFWLDQEPVHPLGVTLHSVADK